MGSSEDIMLRNKRDLGCVFECERGGGGGQEECSHETSDSLLPGSDPGTTNLVSCPSGAGTPGENTSVDVDGVAGPDGEARAGGLTRFELEFLFPAGEVRIKGTWGWGLGVGCVVGREWQLTFHSL
jgi:hypothetical protein